MLAPLLLMMLLAQQNGAKPSDDPAEAVVRLQESIRKNPDIESNYSDLGNLLLRTQNFNEASLVLGAAKAKFPGSAQISLSLGVAYYGLRRFDDAVVALIDAARLAPDVEQPIAFLTRMSENWGERKPEIVALFTAYEKTHPQSALGHFAVGKATADPEQLRAALKLAPKLVDAHIELGALLEARRDFAGAIQSFQQAATLAPRNPIPHYRLSRLYARTGDSARAEAERALHEKLSAEEKAALDQRQGATKHLKLTVRP